MYAPSRPCWGSAGRPINLTPKSIYLPGNRGNWRLARVVSEFEFQDGSEWRHPERSRLSGGERDLRRRDHREGTPRPGAPFLARSWREKACPERSRRVGIFDRARSKGRGFSPSKVEGTRSKEKRTKPRSMSTTAHRSLTYVFPTGMPTTASSSSSRRKALPGPP